MNMRFSMLGVIAMVYQITGIAILVVGSIVGLTILVSPLFITWGTSMGPFFIADAGVTFPVTLGGLLFIGSIIVGALMFGVGTAIRLLLTIQQQIGTPESTS